MQGIVEEEKCDDDDGTDEDEGSDDGLSSGSDEDGREQENQQHVSNQVQQLSAKLQAAEAQLGSAAGTARKVCPRNPARVLCPFAAALALIFKLILQVSNNALYTGEAEQAWHGSCSGTGKRQPRQEPCTDSTISQEDSHNSQCSGSGASRDTQRGMFPPVMQSHNCPIIHDVLSTPLSVSLRVCAWTCRLLAMVLLLLLSKGGTHVHEVQDADQVRPGGCMHRAHCHSAARLVASMLRS